MQAVLNGPSGQTILGSVGLTNGRIQSNQYVVYDRRVSAHHAVISFLKPGYFTITDIGSTNGTFVNGLLLTHNVPHVLQAGDTICIGDTVLTFQIIDQFHILPHDIPPLNENSQISKASENFVTAKITFIGLSGQLVSGTMILIKDSNSMWKVDDLQNI
jgi:pSer/pThr/pTyr-binding forkhead associated (FHA) protein